MYSVVGFPVEFMQFIFSLLIAPHYLEQTCVSFTTQKDK